MDEREEFLAQRKWEREAEYLNRTIYGADNGRQPN